VVILNKAGEEIAVFKGRNYRVVECRDKSIAIYAVPSNVRPEKPERAVGAYAR
jgi:hypothetical protein